MADATDRPGGGGGGVDSFSIEDQERDDTRRRLLAWWSTEIADLDDRIRPIQIVTDAMLELFEARRKHFPNVLDDLPEALDPIAGWVTSRLGFETFFRSDEALDAALGGRYRETNPDKVTRLVLARRERQKRAREARAIEAVRGRFRAPSVTNETIDVDLASVAM